MMTSVQGRASCSSTKDTERHLVPTSRCYDPMEMTAGATTCHMGVGVKPV
jgi:hypothetical protein